MFVVVDSGYMAGNFDSEKSKSQVYNQTMGVKCTSKCIATGAWVVSRLGWQERTVTIVLGLVYLSAHLYCPSICLTFSGTGDTAKTTERIYFGVVFQYKILLSR